MMPLFRSLLGGSGSALNREAGSPDGRQPRGRDADLPGPWSSETSATLRPRGVGGGGGGLGEGGTNSKQTDSECKRNWPARRVLGAIGSGTSGFPHRPQASAGAAPSTRKIAALAGRARVARKATAVLFSRPRRALHRQTALGDTAFLRNWFDPSAKINPHSEPPITFGRFLMRANAPFGKA